jgi:hypothetical protein
VAKFSYLKRKWQVNLEKGSCYLLSDITDKTFNEGIDEFDNLNTILKYENSIFNDKAGIKATKLYLTPSIDNFCVKMQYIVYFMIKYTVIIHILATRKVWGSNETEIRLKYSIVKDRASVRCCHPLLRQRHG